MKLDVVGSGSSGNCYIISNGNEALIIEAGIHPKYVKQALDFNVARINGVISTHSHSDHHKYLSTFASMGFPILSPMTIDEEDMLNKVHRFGRFIVKAFKLTHDVSCYGYWIAHPDIGSLVYATDTEFNPFHFEGVNHLLVEANYNLENIEEDYNAYYHVLRGHQSIQACCEFLSKHDNDPVKNVILCHLSEVNGSPLLFKELAKRSFEIAKPRIEIARKGLSIDLSI